MLERVTAALERAGIGDGSRLCCAFSGGVDSVVMLELLHRLAPARGFVLQAAHVHHGLSANAGQWAQFCAEFCAARDIPFELCRVQLTQAGDGVEAAARTARYAALDALAADWLVLGHHADDQAETLLLNLLRGAGVRGTAAMAMVIRPQRGRAGRLRPLLGCRRAQIVRWARAEGLRWVEDESNAGLAYRRNQLRLRALPVLEESFPAAVPMLARAAENFRAADDLLGELAALDAQACGHSAAGLQRAAALALSDERLANLLRWWAANQGWLAAPRARLLEAVRQLRAVAPGRALRVVLGAFACCAYRDRLWLEAAALPVLAAQRWGGEPALPWGAGRVVFELVEGGGIAASALARAALTELAAPRPGLMLRRETASDARAPRRSLRKWAQARALPAWWRGQLPVLSLDGEAAWLGGFGVLAGFAAAAGETGILPRWEPGPGWNAGWNGEGIENE